MKTRADRLIDWTIDHPWRFTIAYAEVCGILALLVLLLGLWAVAVGFAIGGLYGVARLSWQSWRWTRERKEHDALVAAAKAHAASYLPFDDDDLDDEPERTYDADLSRIRADLATLAASPAAITSPPSDLDEMASAMKSMVTLSASALEVQNAIASLPSKLSESLQTLIDNPPTVAKE